MPKEKRKKHSRRAYMHMLMFDEVLSNIPDDDDDDVVLRHMSSAIDSRLNVFESSTVELVLPALALGQASAKHRRGSESGSSLLAAIRLSCQTSARAAKVKPCL